MYCTEQQFVHHEKKRVFLPRQFLTWYFPLGRTGRKGNTGTSYTLFTPGNAPKARDLVAVLTEAKQVVNPKLAELVGRGGGGGGSRYGGRLRGVELVVDDELFNNLSIP